MEISDLSAVELAERFASRALSPVEALDAVLAVVERWEPHLQATYAFDPKGAYAAARAAEKRWREGQALSPVDGVPVTVKENIASKGVPVPLGTLATALVKAAEDAPPVARLREAGAVIFSKTTMPDYGMLSSSSVELSPADAQPLGFDEDAGRLIERRRSRGRRRIWAAAHRHRHRRLGPAAGDMVRDFHPEAEPWAHPDRSSLYGPRRRADDFAP